MARSGLAFEVLADLPKSSIILWKVAAEACLVGAVIITAQTKTALRLSAYIFVIFIADIILALGAISIAGLLFALAHLFAAFTYIRLPSPPKRPLGSNILAFLPIIAVVGMVLYFILTHRFQILVLFPIFSAIAALGALRSPYSTLSVGLGAVIFWLSDLIFVLAVILKGDATSAGWLVWLSFSAGLLLIALGFIKQHARQYNRALRIKPRH